jgi:hypothetical protein
MRWQWSHARLTLRLTGAELLRSSFGISAVVLLATSMVAAAAAAAAIVEQTTFEDNGRIRRLTSRVRDLRADGSGQMKIWGRSCVTWGAYVGPRSVSAKQFRPGGILVTESHDLNLLCIHAPSRSEINSSAISEDAIVNSIIHGCMGAPKDWLADRGGHLRSAPGFRRRHSPSAPHATPIIALMAKVQVKLLKFTPAIRTTLCADQRSVWCTSTPVSSPLLGYAL